jgi:hypothetical protein
MYGRSAYSVLLRLTRGLDERWQLLLCCDLRRAESRGKVHVVSTLGTSYLAKVRYLSLGA